MKAAFQIKMTGYPAANRDSTVQLVSEATGQTVESKPYLDGSLLVRDLDAGMYQVVVKHPNSTIPIYQGRVRLFDQRPPTLIPIEIDPGLFRGIPVAPDPVADLSPVQKAASSVKARVAPIGNKASGEVIRAGDWNTLASAVSDLAAAVVELTNLVAPQGHAHPELTDKINQVQQTMSEFAQSFGRAQLQYQRTQEVSTMRLYADQVLTFGKATAAESKLLTDKLDDLAQSIDADSGTFTTKLTTASNQALATINTLSTRVESFIANDAVKQLQSIARAHSDLGPQFEPRNEIWHYMATPIRRLLPGARTTLLPTNNV